MLALARAMIARPKLLLLDEPSLGLAPVVVESIYETIREIHQQGTPVLLVEQNAFLALSTAHRAYVIETGQIVLSGLASQLFDDEAVRGAYLGG
jgi:branched-chain amino acid transport system ATP-binding protein